MRAAIVAIVFLLVAVGACIFTWQREGDSIKALVGGDGGPGEKSLFEDIAYWCSDAKWHEYQQERMNKQAEKAAAKDFNYDTTLEALANKKGK